MDKIIVDAMGGDNAPKAIVEGAVQALNADKELYIILTGRQNEIEEVLKGLTYDKSRLEIADCPDVIGMNDIPTEAIRNKGASLVVAYMMLKEHDDICGLVTAGSTGATIAGGQIRLGRIRGINRAALCPAIPNSRGGVTLLCDCGANAECKPVMLCQFAILASAYARAGFGIERPKVGLLNNGTEEHKGDPLHQQTYKYLTRMNDMGVINFIGNIEGRDIMLGDCDVAVSDGFSGNLALKAIEGCGKMMLGVMKKEFSATLRSKIGYLFMRKAIKNMRKQLDFDKYGGALLLGLKKVVVKSHGNSKPTTVAASIAQAVTIHRGGLVGKVENMLSEVDFSSLIPAEEQN